MNVPSSRGVKEAQMSAEISKAVQLLKSGALVAFPTETVYGLGADAQNPRAIREVFRIKQRPSSHPLIVHIANLELMEGWALEVPEQALALARAFWPGPLTLILKKQADVLDEVTGGQDTVALRVPNHPVALALLSAFGGGLVGPSANQFTHLSPTTAAAVREEFGEEIPMVLDGGTCTIGLESTIVDLSDALHPVLRRPGMIPSTDIERVLGTKLSLASSLKQVIVPGMHALHYAPTTPTYLINTIDLNRLLTETHEAPIAIVHYSPLLHPANSTIISLQMPANAKAYAALLYQTLRDADHQKVQKIFVERVPDTLEWQAILDRLVKACGPRS